MNIEEARKIIINPYITEKAYRAIDKENKLTFIVSDHSNKSSIREAIKLLYDVEVDSVNTARTIYGKKAYVKFVKEGSARDLATKLGLV